MINKICLTCRNNFKVHKYRDKTCKFCCVKCHGIYQSSIVGKNSPAWKGKRNKTSHGYIFILVRDTPKQKGVRVYEHRYICENIIGRKLKTTEEVHHLKSKTNNNIRNLMVFSSKSAHRRFEKGGIVKKEEIIFDGRYHLKPPIIPVKKYRAV